ncbi:putative alkaline phosphatase [Apostichopus japonicus]|uniref:alkaline phosphatase n=1 Tax=Stichopus japonicus TaxID=307972 RepID=A0A2G8KEG3_STIJA|nr:putative alkaline phosphatase [Apostichopus japonicus]
MIGKSTGIVTTTRLTHATPAAGYAHSACRNWESDVNLPDEAKENGCIDIAAQLIDFDLGLKVAMGGGRRNFIPVTSADPEYPDATGSRQDGRNLTDEWLEARISADLNAEYVWKLDDFNAIDPEVTDALLGLFDRSHMQYEKNRASDGAGEPSIAEMTEKAIQILSKDEDGFFLLVESGRIDHGHHNGIAHSALTETLAFDEAVERALELVDTDDTLVIVTADHGHVMSMAGYPSRGNPILGLVDGIKGSDDLPYTTLGYMNGYGFRRVNQSFHETGKRPNLTDVDTEDPSFAQDALVPLDSETHGGQDVAIYALGPMSHLFHGVQEQSYIAHAMKYASCVGENKDHCLYGTNRGGNIKVISYLALALIILKRIFIQ